MDQALLVRGSQTARDLDAGIEHLRFPHPSLLRHPVVEASLVDQLHHEIELAMVRARGKNLDDVRIVHRRGGARFVFQPPDFVWIGAQFRAQNFERDKSIQPRVARFVD